jgi:hypothetical protein
LGIGDWAQSPIPNPQSPIPINLLNKSLSSPSFPTNSLIIKNEEKQINKLIENNESITEEENPTPTPTFTPTPTHGMIIEKVSSSKSIEEIKINTNSKTLFKSNTKENINIASTNEINIPSSQDQISTHSKPESTSTNLKEDSSVSTIGETESKYKNFKFNFTKGKAKYNKFLSIYEKIDSNYNFMSMSKKGEVKENEEILLIDKRDEKLEKIEKIEKLDKLDKLEKKLISEEINFKTGNTSSGTNININNYSISSSSPTISNLNNNSARNSLNKNTRVILIKGFDLSAQDLRIGNLSVNSLKLYKVN